MTYITNKHNNITLPYEEGLLEWLHENYPNSQYRIVTDGSPITSVLVAGLVTCIICLAIHHYPYKRNGVERINNFAISTLLIREMLVCVSLTTTLHIGGYNDISRIFCIA